MHIIPIGYEFDRVVAPFRSGYKVNRVYLLSSIEDIDAPTAVLEKHQFYVDKVRKELEGLGIIVIPKLHVAQPYAAMRGFRRQVCGDL